MQMLQTQETTADYSFNGNFIKRPSHLFFHLILYVQAHRDTCWSRHKPKQCTHQDCSFTNNQYTFNPYRPGLISFLLYIPLRIQLWLQFHTHVFGYVLKLSFTLTSHSHVNEQNTTHGLLKFLSAVTNKTYYVKFVPISASLLLPRKIPVGRLLKVTSAITVLTVHSSLTPCLRLFGMSDIYDA